jgi:hypothetical protein
VKPSGQIVKMAKLAAYRALKKIRTNAEARDVDNGLRHSCLTYWMAANGDEAIGTVSRWSGNSPAICKRHYIATVKRAEGAAWWGIRRKRTSEIISPARPEYCPTVVRSRLQ